MVEDPICGMTVDESSRFTSIYQGRTYYFCSRSCKEDFDRNPGKYT
ncbi:YHS domain-containing protein [Candidatus Bathyarchaeota archaeon]|nr:YHS domain-containing protein [Candidatus Bathyarchaeota archaeon]